MENKLPITLEEILEWQKPRKAGLPVNLNGFSKYMDIIKSKGIKVHYVDGCPDFKTVVFDLGGNIGLKFKAKGSYDGEDVCCYIDYEFIDIREVTNNV